MANYKIKDLPSEDRPREKLMKNGAHYLTEVELLAILIRNGTKEKSALDLAKDIIKQFSNLANLAKADAYTLAKIKGIGLVKAVSIVASLELGKRIMAAEGLALTSINSPIDIAKILSPLLRYENKEQFYVLLLNIKNKLIGLEKISEGTLNATIAEPREVFARAITRNAAALIIAHNHPSGDSSPSQEDRSTTTRMCTAGEILGIKVLDHIIVGNGNYYSFKEKSLI